METLPEEMVLKIARQLTVEEMTHCCGVSKGWREAFNRDRLWKPFCDTALEEVLRTTPSIVEPVFDISGGEDSTLVPVCKWRLAFLREKHLKNNWKHNYRRTEAVLEVKEELYREFLTETLIVKWFPDRFQVWDISSCPAVLATEYSFDPDSGGWFDSFVENGLLMVRLSDSVRIFAMDVNNKSVLLKREISFDEMKTVEDTSGYKRQLNDYKGERQRCGLDCVKGNIFVHVNATRRHLDIFDIETGVKIKEEPCPLSVKDHIVSTGSEIFKVLTFPTSDHVVVVKRTRDSHSRNYYADCQIYDPQKLSFFQVCLGQRVVDPYNENYNENYGELHGDYFLISHYPNVDVYDVRSFEMLYQTESTTSIGFYDRGSEKFLTVKANSINMFDLKSRTSENINGPSVASRSQNMFATAYRNDYFRILNKKLLVYRQFLGDPYLLQENGWVKGDLDFERDSAINAGLTKVISQDPPDGEREPNRQLEWYIYHYW